MTLEEIVERAVNPALKLLPRHMDSPEARVLLLAIGLQESEFEHRLQKGGGPAHGFWQFEKGGGCKGVCEHPASTGLMRHLCDERNVHFGHASVYLAIVNDDVLAAGAARLLLFTDPRPLPSLFHGTTAWSYYERIWRPGKPRPDDWIRNYATAARFLGHL